MRDCQPLKTPDGQANFAQDFFGGERYAQRIEKGLIVKLEGIARSQLVYMDYGEAVRVLKRSSEKFEFSVEWGH